MIYLSPPPKRAVGPESPVAAPMLGRKRELLDNIESTGYDAPTDIDSRRSCYE
jgi:hypothetical protein